MFVVLMMRTMEASLSHPRRRKGRNAWYDDERGGDEDNEGSIYEDEDREYVTYETTLMIVIKVIRSHSR